MNLVSYLTEIYGYGNPIFLKDIRIGRKSKTAIRAEFSRLTKSGNLVRKCQGVYVLPEKNRDDLLSKIVTFRDVIEKQFIYSKDMTPGFEKLSIIGYYSGLTFQNMLGISQQVPAISEITTNNTSSKKRVYTKMGRSVILRKGKTEITFQNYKILQFLDSFYWMNKDDIKNNKELLIKYIKENQFTKGQYKQFIKFYGFDTVKKIIEGGLSDAFM